MKTSQTYRQWPATGLAILGGAALLFFGALFLFNLVQYARISVSPQTAFGVVQEKTAEVDGGETSMDRFVLRYSFTAASGLEYQGHTGVGRSLYDSVDLGDRLEVEYAADDPGNNRLRGVLDPDFILIVIVIALNACLFAFAAVREVVRRLARRARARRLA